MLFKGDEFCCWTICRWRGKAVTPDEEGVWYLKGQVLFGVRKFHPYVKTRPSILCVTQKRAFMPLYILLGQQRACMPVYIGKSGDLVG